MTNSRIGSTSVRGPGYRLDFAGCLAEAIGAHGLTAAELGHWLEAGKAGLAGLQADHTVGRLPLLHVVRERADIAEARTALAKLSAGAHTLVIYGTGGSSLGGQTLAQLGGWNLPGHAKPKDRPRLRFYDNLDSESLGGTIGRLELPGTRFIVISKSGGTAETLTQTIVTIDAIKTAGHGARLPELMLGITEPDAGSDVAGLRTHAAEVDGGWVLNGSKTYITNGVRADYVVMAVRTTPEGGHGGISFFLVDTDQPGYTASKLEKLGWHASDTGLIGLDDVFVPSENLLGELHGGFKLIMANFQWERLSMALGAVAGMEFVVERTLRYALERTAFGRPIGTFQVTRHKFAEMATTIEVGRALTYHALRLFVEGQDAIQEVTMAKLATQRAAFDVADTCLQIHGGAGYMVEYGIERSARDARLGPIGGGTDEIMKEILGRTMGL